MAEHQIEVLLREPRKIPSVREDIPYIIMVVLHMWLLARSLRVTVKYICPYLPGPRIGFKKGGLFKLGTAVSEYEGEQFKIIIPKKLLKVVQCGSHGFRGFLLMQETVHKTGILVRKGLDIRAVLLVVDCIHLSSGDRGMGSFEIQIVTEFMAVIIGRFPALFDFLPLTHGNLPAEGEVIDTKVFEDTALDIGIEGFDREANLGMAGKDLVKGLPFLKERGNRLGDQDTLRFGKIDTLPGIGEMEQVSLVSLNGIIEVMVKAAMSDAVTMITGTDRAVTQRAGLLNIAGAVFRTGSAWEGTVFKVGADDGRIKSVAGLKGSMFFDFLSNSSRVFGNRTCDSRFR